MRTIFFILIVFVNSILTVQGQSNRIYHYKNCEIIKGDTVNCKSQDGIKNGKWIQYAGGIKWHTDFVDPKDYEEYEDFHYLISEGNYVNNIKVGTWVYYFPDSRLQRRKIEYFNNEGLKDSLELNNYKSGQTRSIKHWKKGILEKKISYYQTGEIKSNTFYNDSFKDSTLAYYKNGSLLFTGKFKSNDLTEFKIYYENGQLKYSGQEIENWEIKNLKYYDINGQELKFRTNVLGEIISNEGLTEFL